MFEHPLRVGYVLKQYPRLSETFILSEILGLEAAGAEVDVYSLRPPTEGRFHPALARVNATVEYAAPVGRGSFLSGFTSLPDLRQEHLPQVLGFLEHIPEERRARLLLDALWVARRTVDHGVNHLHAHFLTVASHTVHIVHLLTGVPYTVTAHAKDIYRHSVDWELATEVARSATAVVTVCDANLAHLRGHLGHRGCELVRIYNGLAPQPAPVSIDEREPGLILAVGRLVEKKGFEVLLEALTHPCLDRGDVRCVIVGDGDRRADLEARTRELGLASRVSFTGALPQDEVALRLRQARVMAAPCRVGDDGNQDALPTVLLEALGAGLPVVTTPIAGIPEIIEHGREGLLVPPGDSAALARALASLLDDDELSRRMGRAGPEKLHRRFDRRRSIEMLGRLMSPIGCAA
ncbi:MAG TPA: colanic acid biosynthesis glycosyltransferase WcaL [Acidimicrobiales bacterium]|nr:colanic acid biosynthesis glycosyltransferase WcaL [Acidimicrobiales bacterium]